MKRWLMLLGVGIIVMAGAYLAQSQLSFLEYQRLTIADVWKAFILAPSDTQTVAAATRLNVDAPFVQVYGSGGAVTLTGTPTIPNGLDGQLLLLRGTNNTNTVTLQDESSLSGSNVELGAATRVLGNNDLLLLVFQSGSPRYQVPPTGAAWYELVFINH